MEVGETRAYFDHDEHDLEFHEVKEVNLLESADPDILRLEFVFEQGSFIREVAV